MIFWILNILEYYGVHVPAVFGYVSVRMALALVTSLLISIFLGPAFIRKLYELKMGQPIRSSEESCALLGELHKNKKNTPTMGGILILFSMVVSLFLWMDLTHVFTLILLITTIVFGFMGGRDDYLKLKYKNTKGLAGRKKLLVQVVLSTLIASYFLFPAAQQWLQMGEFFSPPVIKEHIPITLYSKVVNEPSQVALVPTTLSLQEYASRIYMPFFKDPVLKLSGAFLVVAILFTIFVLTGASNAVNLTDGLDGLAAGCLILVAATLSIVAFLSNNLDIAKFLNILYIEGSGEIAIYLCAFIGACLGFLWYNGHPAQVFMGDIGSLTLGGIIGVSAILLRKEFLLGLVGGIFVLEALSVIIQVLSFRLRNKKRVFLCAPLHHHFEYKGWPETKVVIRFWIIGLLLAIIGLTSLKFQ